MCACARASVLVMLLHALTALLVLRIGLEEEELLLRRRCGCGGGSLGTVDVMAAGEAGRIEIAVTRRVCYPSTRARPGDRCREYGEQCLLVQRPGVLHVLTLLRFP